MNEKIESLRCAGLVKTEVHNLEHAQLEEVGQDSHLELFPGDGGTL